MYQGEVAVFSRYEVFGGYYSDISVGRPSFAEVAVAQVATREDGGERRSKGEKPGAGRPERVVSITAHSIDDRPNYDVAKEHGPGKQ
jgi:hypothetical protein